MLTRGDNATLHIINRNTQSSAFVVCWNFNGKEWDWGTYCDTLEQAEEVFHDKAKEFEFTHNKIYFFKMNVSNRKEEKIAVRTGVVVAKDEETAEQKSWEKYGSDYAYGLEVWEVTEETDSFCAYFNQ